MTGSIGYIAEQVLQEVKSEKLVKIAQHQMVKEAQEKPVMHTEIGKTLMKLAEDLRDDSEGVTVGEFESFISEANDAE